MTLAEVMATDYVAEIAGLPYEPDSPEELDTLLEEAERLTPDGGDLLVSIERLLS